MLILRFTQIYIRVGAETLMGVHGSAIGYCCEKDSFRFMSVSYRTYGVTHLRVVDLLSTRVIGACIYHNGKVSE